MELVNAELQLQAGEVDVTRGLIALNVAQDYFESLVAVRKGALGGAVSTVSTTANQEYTTFPSGVLRIDRLVLLDSNSKPERELDPSYRVGGHSMRAYWPLNLVSSTSGKPASYYTNGTNIYWGPTPDAVYSVRYYGFAVASDISAAGTFAYPDIVSFPMAAFAARLMKSGVDDDAADLAGLAEQSFKSTLDALDHFHRDGAKGLEYTSSHNT